MRTSKTSTHKNQSANNVTDNNHHQLDATPNGSSEVSPDQRIIELEKQLVKLRKEAEQFEVTRDHHVFDVVLRKEQILNIQDHIIDFFECSDIDSWKTDMQTMFTGLLRSKGFTEMDKMQRGDIFFGYNMIIEFLEKFAPYFPALKEANRETLRRLDARTEAERNS